MTEKRCGHRRHRWPHLECRRVVWFYGGAGYCLKHTACRHPQWDRIERTWHWRPFGTWCHEHGLRRYCHRCGTSAHWWFQATRCRHYRRFKIKGRFPSR